MDKSLLNGHKLYNSILFIYTIQCIYIITIYIRNHYTVITKTKKKHIFLFIFL